MSFIKEFKLLLKSRYPILYIPTTEEERVEYVIRSCVQLYSNRGIYAWDFVDGYVGNPNDNGFASRNPLQALELIERLTPTNPAVFLLKDFHLFLTDISVARKLKNLTKVLRNQSKNIIIIADEVNIPESLKDIITVLDFQLPQPSEIKKELLRVQESLGYNIPEASLNSLVSSCQGLSLERIRRVLSKIIATYKEVNIESLELIFAEKRQIISKTQILEFYPSKDKISDIGGLNNLKLWLKRRSGALSKKAIEYGLPSPRGLLLVGVQGTGKSLTAKAIANEWNLPLLRLDIGKLFGGIVGESESRMRQMIQLSEAVSPCVLWIDEIDKAFSGIDNQGDSGTTSRVLATFITWLSEKESSVFVVATANNIYKLPPEILRKGRFDEIFFIGLPNDKEKELIFKVHLSRLRPKSWTSYDISYLAKSARNFSGAEVEESITEAMHIAFSENREFTTEDIALSIEQFIPLAELNHDKIDELQEWADAGKIRLAS
jgi:ATP-dependent 26S proteasome regulatory subunit